MEVKNAVFQKLKPPCVALSQAALALNGPQGDRDQVTKNLETLKYTLSSVVSPPSTLDSKLADYVFFPLSQVLKASQKVTVRALELCLQCVAILIDQGWRSKIAPQLGMQIVILCTLLAEKQPKGLASEQTTDELRSSAFWCLHHLFSVIALGSDVQQLLISEANIPQLGQSISVILDGIHDAPSIEVQMSACHALETLILTCLDEETQASFLPGIVSKLTRTLTPQTRVRRSPRVLIKCLEILGALLRRTLNDANTSVQGQKDSTDSTLKGRSNSRSVIDEKWLHEAAIQLKPALSNTMKLRSHSRHDVQDALGRLCSVLLQSCRQTLANCSYMALETVVVMSAARPHQERITDLDMLVATDSFISGLLQTLLYDWLQSLITTMQASDEQRKTSKMQQISTCYELLKRGGVDTTTIDHMLAGVLRESVVATLTLPGTNSETTTLTTPVQSLDLDLSIAGRKKVGFNSPLVKFKGQENTMQAIQQFVELVGSFPSAMDFPRDLARSVRQSSGETLLADFWLLLSATQYSLERHDNISDLLNVEDSSRATYREYLEELYSYSLEVLSNSSDEPADPRLQALALRSVALRARIAGKDFRYELVDALYPILHALATPNENLQQDSIVTLNAVTSACDYTSVKDLIVKNVDYLTNAVALKLNAFDVSPQAPQVLLMMVRLAGSSLLPYLEDTVESIFAALEDYHGYQLLVELLFKVLGVIAEEGAKSPQLVITDGSQRAYRSILQERWQPTTMTGLAILLEHDARDGTEKPPDDESGEPHPKRPWKSSDDIDDEDAHTEHHSESESGQVDDVDLPPPAPKTYNLLLKITELTQHFLPSASPSLRTSLLSLIRTTVPAIAKHENSFLPLVNSLWPEIVSRIDDSEPYVVATALDIVQVLCEYAGDFMRTRITQLWPRLVEIHHDLVKEIVQGNLHLPRQSTKAGQQNLSLFPSSGQINEAIFRMQAAPADYGDTSGRLIWNSLVTCITEAVRSVRVSPEIFDEALAMMEPVLGQEDIAVAFMEENSDAVWLAHLRAGTISKPCAPGLTKASRWHFSDIQA